MGKNLFLIVCIIKLQFHQIKEYFDLKLIFSYLQKNIKVKFE